jgi:exopolyphosphatase/guanosine-5'-triphosphate,3'-diphosphate pyrophosphatase
MVLPDPAAPVAVIDLGSNSVRLVVYDALERAPASRFNERRLCGVGREVARTGRLGASGRACVKDSLQRFVAVARGMDCSHVDVVPSTSSCSRGPRRPGAALSGSPRVSMSPKA